MEEDDPYSVLGAMGMNLPGYEGITDMAGAAPQGAMAATPVATAPVAPAAPMGPVQVAGPTMGAATEEYLSGQPGLFMQGGPSVPAGRVQVNGELRHSEPTGQGLPWWIEQADRYKAQRQAEDDAYRMLQRIHSDFPEARAQGGADRARQLQGQLQFDALRRQGVPVQQALLEAGPLMYSHAPRAVSSLVSHLTPPASRPISAYQAAVLKAQQERAAASEKHATARETAAGALHADTAKRQREALMLQKYHIQSKDIQEQLKDPEVLANTTMASRLRRQLGQINRNIDKLGAEEPAAAGPIRIRDKKTGKVFTYKGSAQDVKNDPGYELVQ